MNCCRSPSEQWVSLVFFLNWLNSNPSATGGAIFLRGEQTLPSTFQVTNSRFAGNIANIGGGINFQRQSSNITITGTTFHQNDAVQGGAFAEVGGGGAAHSVLYERLLIEENTAAIGGNSYTKTVLTLQEINRIALFINVGGILISSNALTVLKDVVIVGNIANNSAGGGGLTCNMGNVDIVGNSFVCGNTPDDLDCSTSCDLTLDSSSVTCPYSQLCPYFVDPVNGDDSNSGLTVSDALLTINGAVNRAIVELRPISMGAGLYNGPLNRGITLPAAVNGIEITGAGIGQVWEH